MLVPLLVGVVVFLVLGALLARPLLAFFFAESIGRRAIAAQPDSIALVPSPGADWADVPLRDRVTRELEAAGFSQAGTFDVREMPGLHVRLLVHEAEGARAVVYDHPLAGAWFEIVWRLAAGGSVNVTTIRPTGLNARPGHRMVNLPGATVAAVWARARAEKPAAALAPARAAAAACDFEAAYAESMAHFKRNGVTRMEVVRAGTRRHAA